VSLHEVPLVIDAAGLTWRNLMTTAIYLGVRKGEQFGLRGTSISMSARSTCAARENGG